MRRGVGRNLSLVYAGVLPQFTGDLVWIDAGRPPPRSFVAGAMDRAVMDTAEGHGEFIAGPAAERARLRVAKMMRVGWPATADEARLLGDIAKVLPVAITPWRSNGEDALVDTDDASRDVGDEGGTSQRSGASRSSSPAMPTSVNRA